MKTYVVGDLQGCHGETVALVEKILETEHGAGNQPPSILFCGDLINRGPDSLSTLRYVQALSQGSDGRIDAVLGNHDLHLLAVANGIRPESSSDTIEHILAAADREALLHWLRLRPMAIARDSHLLVHGGVLPQWTAQQAMALAGEVEAALRGDDWVGFLREMYGNQPDRWDDGLSGAARLRCIVNALTRMRFCSADGVMDFKMKESAWADSFDRPDAMVRSAGPSHQRYHRGVRPLVGAGPAHHAAPDCAGQRLRVGRQAVGRVPGRPQPAAGGLPGIP
jgi:bis(5'-nucleosyl)-tetraphosphatase (symmetrical)